MQLPEFLTEDPDGEVRLTGHRIGLYTIIRLHREGYSPEQIAAELPTLSLDLVRQVLAFARQNQAEVDAYVDAYRDELERQAAQPPGPGVVRIRQLMERVERADAERASDPDWMALSVVEKLQRIKDEGAGTR